MNPEDSVLHRRFAELREAEPEPPGFRITLAAARQRAETPTSARVGALFAPFAAVLVVVLFATSFFISRPDPASLSQWPMLLPPADTNVPFFTANESLPSDALLPFHLQIRL